MLALRKKISKSETADWVEETQRIAAQHQNYDRQFLINQLLEKNLTVKQAKRIARKALAGTSQDEEWRGISVGFMLLLLVVLGFIFGFLFPDYMTVVLITAGSLAGLLIIAFILKLYRRDKNHHPHKGHHKSVTRRPTRGFWF